MKTPGIENIIVYDIKPKKYLKNFKLFLKF
jgi:hypothetical protein